MKFVVGDIHGEISKLKILIDKICQTDNQPEFIFIGDYIDKGEDSYATLQYLVGLSAKFPCTFLWGNHDYMWWYLNEGTEERTAYLQKYGGMAAVRSFGTKTIADTRKLLADEFEDFFLGLQPSWKDENYVAAHSGIHPDDFETEVQDIPLKRLLFNRYNFIKHDSMYLGRYKIIFGHTGFYYAYADQYKIGIDTAACFSKTQPISAFCIETGMMIDSNDRAYKIEDTEPNSCPNIVRTKP